MTTSSAHRKQYMRELMKKRRTLHRIWRIEDPDPTIKARTEDYCEKTGLKAGAVVSQALREYLKLPPQ